MDDYEKIQTEINKKIRNIINVNKCKEKYKYTLNLTYFSYYKTYWG